METGEKGEEREAVPCLLVSRISKFDLTRELILRCLLSLGRYLRKFTYSFVVNDIESHAFISFINASDAMFFCYYNFFLGGKGVELVDFYYDIPKFLHFPALPPKDLLEIF